MTQKEFVFLPTAHHGGLWFASDIIEHKLNYTLRGFREVVESGQPFESFKPGQLFSGHITAFARMGSGIINFKALKDMYDFFNKDGKAVSVTPIRDVLVALVSAARRAPGRVSGWIVSEYVTFAKDFDAIDPFYLPIDLYLPPNNDDVYEKRFKLLTEFERRLGAKIGDLFKEDLARQWPEQNRATDYCMKRLGDPMLELKYAYENGDIDLIKKTIPKEWEYLIEMGPILQPFFEGLGYKDLLWFDKKKKDITNTPHVKVECEYASDLISTLKPKSILNIESYPHFVHGLLGGHKITSVHMRRENGNHAYKKVIVGEAKDLDLKSNSFDVVVSIGSIGGIGLGHFGSGVDYDAHEKTFNEMKRVLKPGGHLIFTVPATQAHINVIRMQPVVVPVDQRIYNDYMISTYCEGLFPISEKYFDVKAGKFCEKSEVPKKWKPEVIDFVYMGCWRK